MKIIKQSAMIFLGLIIGHSAIANDMSINKDLMYSDGVIEIEQNIDTPFLIDSYSDIVYSQKMSFSGLKQMKMHILSPRTTKKNPVLLYFPGGGFFGANFDKYVSMRYFLAKAGFVVASVEYSVVPDTFPSLLEDGKSAIRYLKEHAEQFNIDSTKVGVFGDSAGGYMAQILAVTSGIKEYDKGEYLNQTSDVNASVSIYGISNLLNIGEGLPQNLVKPHHPKSVTEALLVHGVAFNDFEGLTIDDDKEKALKASPINYVKKSNPPMMLMHGTNDYLVSPNQSKQMYDKLKENGVDAKFVLLKGAAHGDLPWYQENIMKIVKDFFIKHLGKTSVTSDDDTLNL